LTRVPKHGKLLRHVWRPQNPVRYGMDDILCHPRFVATIRKVAIATVYVAKGCALKDEEMNRAGRGERVVHQPFQPPSPNGFGGPATRIFLPAGVRRKICSCCAAAESACSFCSVDTALFNAACAEELTDTTKPAPSAKIAFELSMTYPRFST